jgi:hypothetical protein
MSQKGSSVLKNAFVAFSDPHLGAWNPVFVVYWACLVLVLDHQPLRQRLFQQPRSF